MTIFIGSEEKRVGLALSGGGFRAAAFHLGAFRKLHQIGLLWKLDLLTCVSGGSIAGAFLACHWGEDDALDKLENYLRTKSIAVSSVIGGVLDPFHSRLDKLAATYERDLYGQRTLGSLQNGPRLYLNSTNLATGNMFFFVAGGGPASKAEMGEWELGTNEAAGFPLSRAVAASSAFPPVFPPLRVDQAQYPAAGVDYVTLADGGVYDNLDPATYAAHTQPMLSHINVGTGEDITIRELATTIASVIGYRGRIDFDASKPDGTPRKLMDVSRLHALGCRATVGLAEGLARAYADFRAA